jgi:AcrR family transcriptional regulator
MSGTEVTEPSAPRRRGRGRAKVGYGEGREALLNAAIKVVARGGLRGLTYRSVAQEAGVTHGLVVHYFGSRDALIAATLEHSITASLDISYLESGAETPTVGGFAAGVPSMVEDDPDLQVFQYEMLLESRRRPELQPHVKAVYDQYFEATGRELDRMLPGRASLAMRRLVFAALDGLVLHQLTMGDPADTEAALAELRSLLGEMAGSHAVDGAE